MKPHIKKVNGLWSCEGFKAASPKIAMMIYCMVKTKIPINIIHDCDKVIDYWHQERVKSNL